MHGQQQQQAQDEDRGGDQLRTGARMRMVNMLSRSATRRAPAFHHWTRALSADQVFAAHRNPFRLASGLQTPALAVM
jgi:hypothetical protein